MLVLLGLFDSATDFGLKKEEHLGKVLIGMPSYNLGQIVVSFLIFCALVL